jgi:hypothetical protein
MVIDGFGAFSFHRRQLRPDLLSFERFDLWLAETQE